MKELQSNTRHFTEKEVEDLVWEGNILHEEMVEQARWGIAMFSVVEVDDIPYGLNWTKAATEMQEHTYFSQEAQVMEEREVTIKEWLPKNKEEE